MALTSAELNAALSEENRTASSVLNAMQLSHRRAVYFRRLVLVQRRVKLAIAACEESISIGSTQAARNALESVERALCVLGPAWQHVRHLFEQSFFINAALALLALLARMAKLLSEQHAVLSEKLPAAEDPSSATEPKPWLLARLLVMAPAAKKRALEAAPAPAAAAAGAAASALGYFFGATGKALSARSGSEASGFERSGSAATAVPMASLDDLDDVHDLGVSTGGDQDLGLPVARDAHDSGILSADGGEADNLGAAGVEERGEWVDPLDVAGDDDRDDGGSGGDRHDDGDCDEGAAVAKARAEEERSAVAAIGRGQQASGPVDFSVVVAAQVTAQVAAQVAVAPVAEATGIQRPAATERLNTGRHHCKTFWRQASSYWELVSVVSLVRRPQARKEQARRAAITPGLSR